MTAREWLIIGLVALPSLAWVWLWLHTWKLRERREWLEKEVQFQTTEIDRLGDICIQRQVELDRVRRLHNEATTALAIYRSKAVPFLRN
jgi:hypothetical protein